MDRKIAPGKDDALIRPKASSKSPRLGPVAVMAASAGDMEALARTLYPGKKKQYRLYTSRIIYSPGALDVPALVGPLMGAPYAAMVLELILAWGVSTVLFTGWCGSIHSDVRVGDLLLPTGAWPDDGTSKHYGHGGPGPVFGQKDCVGSIAGKLKGLRQPFHRGLIWTTDGVFRETSSRIALYKKRGALAVEMELAALMAVADFRKAALGALLVVSDELFAMKWRPGFNDEGFARGRRAMWQAAVAVCREISNGRY